MFSSQVVSGISGGVLGIAGLLLVMSSMKQRRVVWRIGIGVPLFGLGLFILVTDLPQYALGFSILATLAMAFAALLNIKQSADQENRDRRERYLNEILGWLREIEDSIFPLIDLDIYKNLYKEIQEDKDLVTNLGVTKQDIERQRRSGRVFTDLDILIKEIRNAQYFKKVSLKLNSELSELINNILCLLEQRRQLIIKSGKFPLDSEQFLTKEIKTRVPELLTELIKYDTKPLDGLNLSEININNVLTGRNAGHIRKSANKAIDKAIELKYVL